VLCRVSMACRYSCGGKSHPAVPLKFECMTRAAAPRSRHMRRGSAPAPRNNNTSQAVNGDTTTRRHRLSPPPRGRCDRHTRTMSFNYDRYDRRQNSSGRRNTLGYWVPLTLTVVVATAGLAAWVWSAREDHEEASSDDDLSYGEEGRRARAMP
jgi:hypothetical protein